VKSSAFFNCIKEAVFDHWSPNWFVVKGLASTWGHFTFYFSTGWGFVFVLIDFLLQYLNFASNFFVFFCLEEATWIADLYCERLTTDTGQFVSRKQCKVTWQLLSILLKCEYILVLSIMYTLRQHKRFNCWIFLFSGIWHKKWGWITCGKTIIYITS